MDGFAINMDVSERDARARKCHEPSELEHFPHGERDSIRCKGCISFVIRNFDRSAIGLKKERKGKQFQLAPFSLLEIFNSWLRMPMFWAA